MSAGKGKVKKELLARKVKHRFFLEVGTWSIQKLSWPMPAGKDKRREDEKRVGGPKGQA